MVRMTDELIILGSGGGRHHIRTQHRATGGILYKFNEIYMNKCVFSCLILYE